MAFIKFFFLLLKIFEKVEKTGIISTKFSFRCTSSVILGLPLYVTQVSCHMLAELKLSWKTNSKPMQQLLALHEFHNCAYFLEKKVFKKSKFFKKNISKEKNPERIYWFSNLKMAFAIL